jgi:para-nitrobenzyl esterase
MKHPTRKKSAGKKHGLERRDFLAEMLALTGGAAASPVLASGVLSPPALANAQAPIQDNSYRPLIVQTTGGAVRGASRNGVVCFKGIPYAGSPAGENRFKAPPPLKPWTGVRDALAYGPASIQPLDPNRPKSIPMFPTSEDCLVLNIWTPAFWEGQKRPVMFYSHGGGFVTGNGGAEVPVDDTIHDGSALARNYDVVVVTTNHRLGVLGYLYLGDILGEEYAASGCAGMLDIIAALRWVRDNISQFGGDPDRVMLFGESGGGMKTSILTAMPAAHGLFNRASVESGSMLNGISRERATETTRAVLSKLGLSASQARQLLTLPASRFAAVSASPLVGFRMGPVVDGHYLPANPYNPAAPAISANVPMIVGTNENEAIFFYQNQPAIYTMTEAQLHERTASMFHDQAGQVLSVYHHAYPHASPTNIFLSIMTARFMWANAVTMAERKAQQNGAPVYMYMFRYQSNALANQNPPYPLRACHAMEMPFKFDHPQFNPMGGITGMIGANPGRFQTALNMSGAWAAFARNGSPDCEGIPHWPPYTLDGRETMFINAECRVVGDPWREERLLWSKLLKYTMF